MVLLALLSLPVEILSSRRMLDFIIYPFVLSKKTVSRRYTFDTSVDFFYAPILLQYEIP